MSETVANILAEIERLSPHERAEVETAVLNGLGGPPEPSPDEFESTLSRRIAEIRSGAVAGIPASDVFAKLHARRK